MYNGRKKLRPYGCMMYNGRKELRPYDLMLCNGRKELRVYDCMMYNGRKKLRPYDCDYDCDHPGARFEAFKLKNIIRMFQDEHPSGVVVGCITDARNCVPTIFGVKGNYKL